jgi:hypothetical protein
VLPSRPHHSAASQPSRPPTVPPCGRSRSSPVCVGTLPARVAGHRRQAAR